MSHKVIFSHEGTSLARQWHTTETSYLITQSTLIHSMCSRIIWAITVHAERLARQTQTQIVREM